MSYLKFIPDQGENFILRRFRGYCAEACDRLQGNAITAPMKRITAVGAEIIEGRLSANDRSHLEISLDWCEHLGIPISPDFELAVMNLVYGNDHDFLNPGSGRPDTDLLIVCNIPDLPAGCFSTREHCLTSPYAELGAWYKAAEKCGSLVVVTVGLGFGEVGVKDFAPPEGTESVYGTPVIDFVHPLTDTFHDSGILVCKELCGKISPPSPERIRESQDAWKTRGWWMARHFRLNR